MAQSFVISYAGNVNLLQDWSPLEMSLENTSTQIDLQVGDGKNERIPLNDALRDALLKLAAGNSSESKALIVIGEGNDLGSATKYSQIKKLAKSGHIQCFALLVASHDLIEAASDTLDLTSMIWQVSPKDMLTMSTLTRGQNNTCRVYPSISNACRLAIPDHRLLTVLRETTTPGREHDTQRRPNDSELLTYVGVNVRNRAHLYKATAKRCRGYSQKAQCTRGVYKTITIHIHEPARQHAST